MTAKKTRANGEGSIYEHRNGYAAYSWVAKPDGTRTRKYVYGKTRDEVHDKWLDLQVRAKKGPMATKAMTVGKFAAYWLTEIVKPNLSPGTYATYEVATRLYIVPGLGSKRLDRLNTPAVQMWLNTVARTCQCCAQGKDARRKEEKRRCCGIGECCDAPPLVVAHPAAAANPAGHAHVRHGIRLHHRQPSRQNQTAGAAETTRQSMEQRGSPAIPGTRAGSRSTVLRRLRADPGAWPPQG